MPKYSRRKRKHATPLRFSLGGRLTGQEKTKTLKSQNVQIVTGRTIFLNQPGKKTEGGRELALRNPNGGHFSSSLITCWEVGR
jgi:hypothetical protein